MIRGFSHFLFIETKEHEKQHHSEREKCWKFIDFAERFSAARCGFVLVYKGEVACYTRRRLTHASHWKRGKVSKRERRRVNERYARHI